MWMDLTPDNAFSGDTIDMQCADGNHRVLVRGHEVLADGRVVLQYMTPEGSYDTATFEPGETISIEVG